MCCRISNTAKLKPEQRLWTNSGCATMSYDIPASIGACLASGKRYNNMYSWRWKHHDEFTGIANYYQEQSSNKNVILNNNGYVSIFQTHRNFFNGVEVGGGVQVGCSFPKFENFSSKAFGFPYSRAENHDQMKEAIKATLEKNGPAICELTIDENQVFAPKLGAKQHADGRITSPALEDLSPFYQAVKVI